MEQPSQSPYLKIHLASIVAVYPDFGSVKVKWLTMVGDGRDLVPLTFPFFSNPTVVQEGAMVASATTEASSKVVGKCYGDICLPAINDIAVIGFCDPSKPVVIGLLPANFRQQTSPDSSKSAVWGTMRSIVEGELSRKSKQQAEIYQDKAGAIHLIAYAQPTLTSTPLTEDGSNTDSFTEIDDSKVPTKELAHVTVGEVYADDTFETRAVTEDNKKIVLQIKMKTGVTVKIDADGNVESNAAAGKTMKITGGTANGTKLVLNGDGSIELSTPNYSSNVVINNGSLGVARLNDKIKSVPSDGADALAFWAFMQALLTALTTSPITPLDGGATYKTGITAILAAAGFTTTAPQTLDGHVSTASLTVRAGD